MDGDSVRRRLRNVLQSAGRQFGEAQDAFTAARRSALADLPQDEDGTAKIVCRRYAERRSVGLDDAARPHCFDADHPDCQGCAEDVADGTVETW
jgi:hypothetical protein